MKEGKVKRKCQTRRRRKGCAPVCIDIIMNESDFIILSVYTSTVNVLFGRAPVRGNLFFQLLWITGIHWF